MSRTITALLALGGFLTIGCAHTGSTKVVDQSARANASSSGKPDSRVQNPDWVSTPGWAIRENDCEEGSTPERNNPMCATVAISFDLIEVEDEKSWGQFESALARLQVDVKPGQSAVLPRWIGRRLRDSVQKSASLRTSPAIGLVFNNSAEYGAWVGEEGVPGNVGFFRATPNSDRECELRLSIQSARKGNDDSAASGRPRYWRIDDRVTLKPGEWYLSLAEATGSARPMAVLLEVLEIRPDGMPIANAEGAAIHGVARRID